MREWLILFCPTLMTFKQTLHSFPATGMAHTVICLTNCMIQLSFSQTALIVDPM